MTDERCKQILYDLRFVISNEYYSDDVEEALDMAIKALEQEDVLEKVRAEIVQMNDDVSKMLMPFDSIEKVKYTTGFIDGLGSTLDVIDKYREGGAE